ncbi:MAG: esterase [Betaproteobacteria bacterium RIFCSPLOWO2_12_FULL_63_13]|nr:MAG: esterase [Betaproteobacteria bacterium RIFCSPLOWO2_12_FULL_63_13]
MTLYRGMDRAQLDAAYNNSAAVADSPAILADWQARSELLRAAHPQGLDLRYGLAERNRIDYFAAERAGPVLVFIHGGYWQMRAKETFSFLAAGPLAHGIHVALVGYTLAPQKRLNDIVAEIRSAIGWLAAQVSTFGGDPARIYVSGWSAGGHLAAMSIAEPGVRGGLAISGIYDLEPIRLCYLNDKLSLDRDEARRLSPLSNLPKRSGPLITTYGDAELPELRRQSQEFTAARMRAGLPGRLVPLPGHNHFTILEELASPDGALTMLARELVAP